MREPIAWAGAALVLLLSACGRSDALPPPEPAVRPALWIDVEAARVTVIPEARADVVVVQADKALTVGRQGQALTVSDGRGAARDCRTAPNGAAPPQLTVRAPPTVDIHSSGAVDGRIGPAGALHLTSGACGRWRADSASGPADLVQVGAGEIKLGEARTGLTARLVGSGAIQVARAGGPLSAEVDGSGRVEIDAGVTPRAFLHVDGSGGIEHRGQVGSLRAELEGSGRIQVATVTGQVQRRLQGSGEVNWGRPAGRKFCGGTACIRAGEER